MSDVNAATMNYERGTEVVESVYTPHAKPGEDPPQAKTAHGLRGTLEIHGLQFDTLERLDGYVRLDEGTYTCRLEESGKHTEKGYLKVKRKRRQIRPSHSKRNNRGQVAAILIHSGAYPHHFEGCIGIGIEDTKGIHDSVKSMDQLFDELAGFEVGKTVYLTVKGNVPAK